MRDAAFALCWLVLLPVSLISAFPAVLVWIWVAIFAPNDQLFGFMSDLPFNKIIAGATFFALLISPERKSFYVDKTIVAWFLLAAIGTVSAADSYADSANNWDLYYKLLKELTLALVITGVLWSRFRLHMVVFTVCLAIGFEAVVEAVEFIVSAGGHKVLGARSVGDNNALGVEVLMSIPLLWYLLRYSAARYTRIVVGVVIALSVVTVVATFSRGAFIGLVVLGLFVLAGSKNKLAAGAVIVAATILFAVAAPTDYTNRIDTIDQLNQDDSVAGRIGAWKVSTAIALDRPLFGGGFHAVQEGEVWRHYMAAADAMTIVETPPLEPVPRAAHSIYFEILGDLGFLGLLAFAALLLISLRATARVRRIARKHPAQAWAGDLAQMLQISMVLYCVCGAALSMAYWEGFYIFLAIVSRLQRTVVEAVASEGILATGAVSFARGAIAGRRAAVVTAGRRMGRRT
jgi:probable O-glycosylation ligase (exosortase A-associated)